MRTHPPLAARVVLFVFLYVAILLVARRARAEPLFGFGESKAEDRYTDGDLDEDDLASVPGLARRGLGGADLRAGTWLSLVAFGGANASGMRELGGMALVGIALDRAAEGRGHVLGERAPTFADDAGASPPIPAPTPAPTTVPPALARPPVDPQLARGTVRAAWRAVGMDATDERVDAMIARARASAALPETRLRVMKLFTDAQHDTYVDPATATPVSNITGARLWLEARLTWRFDRLLYADDEPTLERIRLEREEARTRLASHVLELLFMWQRALFETAASGAGSRAELDASLRRSEAEIALDTITAGWFHAQPAVKARAPAPDPSPPRPPPAPHAGAPSPADPREAAP